MISKRHGRTSRDLKPLIRPDDSCWYHELVRDVAPWKRLRLPRGEHRDQGTRDRAARGAERSAADRPDEADQGTGLESNRSKLLFHGPVGDELRRLSVSRALPTVAALLKFGGRRDDDTTIGPALPLVHHGRIDDRSFPRLREFDRRRAWALSLEKIPGRSAVAALSRSG